MAWISDSARERIRELESLLRDSVSRAVYTEALTRISDLEKRNNWQADMLLRRGGTYPLPAEKTEPVAQPQMVRQVTDTDIAKAEAIRQAGLEAGAKKQVIEQAIKTETGWDEADIDRAINGQRFDS